jgi:hypothetical protein
MCITTAVLIAGGVATTGGLAAVVVKIAGAKQSAPTRPKEDSAIRRI